MTFRNLPPEMWDIARSIWKKNKDRSLTTDQWCALFLKAGILDTYMQEAQMDATRRVIQALSREARKEGRKGEQIGNVRLQDKQGEWKWMYKEYDDMSEEQLANFINAEQRKIGVQRRKTARACQFALNKYGDAFRRLLDFDLDTLPEIHDDLGDEDEGVEV